MIPLFAEPKIVKTIQRESRLWLFWGRRRGKWGAVKWGQSFSFETSSGEGVHNSVTMLDATELYI